MQKLQDATVDVERLGELFLITRARIIEADKQRQANREALSTLRRSDRAASSGGASSSGGGGAARVGSGGGGGRSPQRKVWLLSPAAAAGSSNGGAATFTRHAVAGGIMALEAEQRRLDSLVEALHAEQKRLTGLLADKGAGPQGSGDAMVRAMLTLRDSGG